MELPLTEIGKLGVWLEMAINLHRDFEKVDICD